MNMKVRAFAVSGLAATLSSASFAVVSTFDNDFDGWTQTSGVSWQSPGGNPGGYLLFQDSGPANGGQISAPATFHGDWLSTYGAGGSFSADYSVFTAGQFQPFPMWVRITGSGGVIGKNFAGDFSQSIPWSTMSVGLAQSNWAVLSGSWSGCLSSVTDVTIYMPSATSGDEVTGIDNVKVVPEPSSLLVLGLGAFALKTRRRRII